MSPSQSGAGVIASENLSAGDMSFLRTLVQERSAIVLGESKHYLLAGRLGPVVRKENLSSIGELVDLVRKSPRGRLEGLVIEAMTTNETSFFRDIHPFTSMTETIIPEILAERGAAAGVTIWCGASSSGQEPYSLAIAISERFPELITAGRLRIVATDLAPSMVERTMAGRFSQSEVNRGMPARQLVRFFQQEGNDWVAKRELRAVIDARPLNLIGPWPNLPRCDVVFLRNVLIYFNTDTKRTILERIRKEVLRPGGHLFLGSSETTLNIDQNWNRRTVGRSVTYEAPGGVAPRVSTVASGPAASPAPALAATGPLPPRRTVSSYAASTAARLPPGAGAAARPFGVRPTPSSTTSTPPAPYVPPTPRPSP